MTRAVAECSPAKRVVDATLTGQGLYNRGTAEQLFISEAAVKMHISNLIAKAGIRDRADAARWAIATGPA